MIMVIITIMNDSSTYLLFVVVATLVARQYVRRPSGDRLYRDRRPGRTFPSGRRRPTGFVVWAAFFEPARPVIAVLGRPGASSTSPAAARPTSTASSTTRSHRTAPILKPRRHCICAQIGPSATSTSATRLGPATALDQLSHSDHLPPACRRPASRLGLRSPS